MRILPRRRHQAVAARIEAVCCYLRLPRRRPPPAPRTGTRKHTQLHCRDTFHGIAAWVRYGSYSKNKTGKSGVG
ncbi:hypothetical protein E2C01_101704 [Portunus trituberculatus]|uniref:Uncharacterized protein n=1 Tax=Portunus trituberculatus TaxID=210409 RepID=A0A5B7K6C1_PORTR|nr:hypothetical protein [Portunus trituberculatus]